MTDAQNQEKPGLAIIDPIVTFCDGVFIAEIPGESGVLELGFASGGTMAKRFAFTRDHLKRLKDLIEKSLDPKTAPPNMVN